MLYALKMFLLGLAIIVVSLYILQIGILATIIFVASLILSWIVTHFSGQNFKSRVIRYMCIIISMALACIDTSAPLMKMFNVIKILKDMLRKMVELFIKDSTWKINEGLLKRFMKVQVHGMHNIFINTK